jgi:hypothetical protein
MADVTSPFGFPYPEQTDLVRDGAQDIENLATSLNDQLALSYQYVGTRYYTSSGTFAKADPFGDASFDGAKMRAIRVRMVGGGGGSGGNPATTVSTFALSGSGGGGAYAEKFITNIAGLSTSETITRGAGGAGGAAGANAGSAGGQSSAFTVSANGGAGGTAGAAAELTTIVINPGGGDGTTANADLTIRGSDGGFGMIASINRVAGLTGGASALGQSTRTVMSASGTGRPGVAGALHGGGASGAASATDCAAVAGAAGGNGIVIVDVFS